jgi:hypothetical protein
MTLGNARTGLMRHFIAVVIVKVVALPKRMKKKLANM